MKSYFLKTLKKILLKDKIVFASVCILLFWIVIGLAPILSGYFSNVPTRLATRLQGVSIEYWFGVDTNGQSIGLLLMNGASTSIIVSLFTVSMSLLLGVPLGALSGFFGGKIDLIICRFMDIILAFPPLILPITIMAFFGGGLFNVVLALSLTGWVSYARLIRGQFLTFKEREFVLAAKSLGSNHFRIMFLHIFPNIISPLAVQCTFSLASVIISEAGLSFLGLGVGGTHVSWGGILNSAKDYLTTHPLQAFFPAAALFSVIASLNFLGEALQSAFDPKKITLI